MFGFRPIGTNAMFEALGKICQRKRVTVNGHKLTAYVVPEPPGAPWPPNVVKLPNGNKEEEIPFDLPINSRAGTAYAQA